MKEFLWAKIKMKAFNADSITCLSKTNK